MSTSRIFWAGYILASVLLGVAAGHWFFGLFDQVVPPAVMTSFNRSTAHGYFLLNGALLGFVVALWGILAFWVARVTGGKRASSEASPK